MSFLPKTHVLRLSVESVQRHPVLESSNIADSRNATSSWIERVKIASRNRERRNYVQVPSCELVVITRSDEATRDLLIANSNGSQRSVGRGIFG